jgi:Holliday junction resolvase
MSYEFEDLDDFVTDDGAFEKKKKKINGKKKGNRIELELSKILNKRFGTGFSRSVGSGNRWSQVNNLPQHAKEVFSGDLVVPQGFKFVLESKGGYEGIDLNSIFTKGSTELDGFLSQVSKDAKRCGRKPILCWKKKRRPWFCVVLTEDLPQKFKYQLNYGNWSIIALEELLKLEDSFFVETTPSPSL